MILEKYFCCVKFITFRPHLVDQYSMAPRLSSQFVNFSVSIPKRDCRYKENNIKYRRFSWKFQGHVRIFIIECGQVLHTLNNHKSDKLHFRTECFLLCLKFSIPINQHFNHSRTTPVNSFKILYEYIWGIPQHLWQKFTEHTKRTFSQSSKESSVHLCFFKPLPSLKILPHWLTM